MESSAWDARSCPRSVRTSPFAAVCAAFRRAVAAACCRSNAESACSSSFSASSEHRFSSRVSSDRRPVSFSFWSSFSAASRAESLSLSRCASAALLEARLAASARAAASFFCPASSICLDSSSQTSLAAVTAASASFSVGKGRTGRPERAALHAVCRCTTASLSARSVVFFLPPLSPVFSGQAADLQAEGKAFLPAA